MSSTNISFNYFAASNDLQTLIPNNCKESNISIICLVGKQSDGKTTLIRYLRYFHPSVNITSENLPPYFVIIVPIVLIMV